MKIRFVSQDEADFELWQNSGTTSSTGIDSKLVKRVIDERLTPLQRDCLQRYYYDRLTMREIAKLRGVALSTVSRTIKRAENRIRDALKYCVRG